MRAHSLAASLLTVLLAAGPAAGQGAALQAAGKGFVEALATKAAECKGKITGINLQSVKDLASCLIDAAKGAAKSALLDLARGLYDEGIELLKSNAPKAKAKIEELAEKITAVLPQAKMLVGPVLAGFTTGSETMAGEAAKCREKITALDLATVKATFECLGAALKTSGKAAGAAVLQGLFEEFVGLLHKGCALATGKLGELAGKVASLIPAAKGIIEPILSAINSGCNGALDKIQLPAIR
jgi:hypothetical protein